MSERPRWARWVTRISLVAGLLALVYTVQNTGLRTIGHYFQRIGWWWTLVVVFEIAITTLDAIAIRAFMSPEHHNVKLRSTLLAQLAGRAINAVTPSGNLGEALKVSVLTEHVSQSRAVATILLYNVTSFSVELAVVAIATPIMVLFMPMSPALQALMLTTGGVCLVLSLGLYALVRRGMLVSFGRFVRRLRIVSQARFDKWESRLRDVDDKVRLVAGARRRDRWIGIGAVITSRFTSMSLSFMILYAIGEQLTLGFMAAYIVGGFGIYMLSSLVPMGLGISEGGNYKLFQQLGYNPAPGVALVIARRVTLIMYAAIGLVLLTASETVKRAKARSTQPVAVPPTSPLMVSLPPAVTVAVDVVAE